MSGKHKTLHLVLTHHWYDEIASGRKRIEYRTKSPKWMRDIWNRRHEYTHVRFQRAYCKNPPTQVFRIWYVDMGECPYEGVDDEKIRIHFKENRENTHRE